MSEFEGTRNTSRPPRRRAEMIDPAALMRIRSLELRARVVVEGFQAGLNRSPCHGFSVEFTEYRQYATGDDLRYLDWKLYARSDRYYVKQFEDETNLRCHLLLDMSRSMDYGTAGHTKLEYARTLAATLAWFLAGQHDAVGLTTFDEEIRTAVPARYRPGHLRRILVALEQSPRGRATGLVPPLERIASQASKRGLVVVISDLLAALDGWERVLGCVRARGHELLVLQVLDPAEREFSFTQPVLFQDAETGQRIFTDPDAARAAYLQRFKAHQTAISANCARFGIEHRLFTTTTPLEAALFEFLQTRAAAARSRGPRAGQTARRRAA